MHPRLLALVSLVPCVASLSAAVANGDFTAGDAQPSGWEHTKEVTIARDTTVFSSAPASLRLDLTGGEGNANQKLTGLAGKTVRFAGKVRGEGSLRSVQAFILVFDNSWKSLGWTTLAGFPSDGGWHDFSKDVAIPAGAGTVLFGIQAKGTGSAWFDDASAGVGSDATPAPVETVPLIDLSRYSGPDPKLLGISAVSPQVVTLRIRQQWVESRAVEPYVAQPGDEIVTEKHHHRVLMRGGKKIGHIAGPPDRLHVRPYDGFTGKPLQLRHALDPAQWSVTRADGSAIAVTAVSRKSRPVDKQLGGNGMGGLHEVFLTLAAPLVDGEVLTVANAGIAVDGLPATHTHAPTTFSEAVHVSHVGWRPDDPGKIGYLSCWTGTGGGLTYPDGIGFALRRVSDGSEVFRSTATIAARADQVSHGLHAKGRNFARSHVLALDFTAYTTPGEYVLSVDGIGASFPFRLADDAWESAVRVVHRGFFHHRSGVAYAPPHADYTRPRPFHPDDGTKPFVLTIGEHHFSTSIGDGKLERLLEFKTDTVVPQAWGGLHDAGDYDRRVRHLGATRQQLEVIETWLDWAKTVTLPIPESSNDIPDLLDEALWNLDCYRRMQNADGGVHGGIETDGHPAAGEPGWLNSLTVMVFAPDTRSGWQYAATAAQAAWIFRRLGDTKREQRYGESAVKAMQWAEAAFAKDRGTLEAAGGWWRERSLRHLAAVMCYRLTADETWHTVVRETAGWKDGKTVFQWTSHDQGQGAFIYAGLPGSLGDDALRSAARQALINHANFKIDFASKQPIPFVKWDAGGPLINSSFSAPQNDSLARAYALTGERRYLDWLVRTTTFSVGNNPMNLALTTGLGHRAPEHVLYIDQWHMALPTAPAGIPVYGPVDNAFFQNDWGYTWIINKDTTAPAIREWPVFESYFDVPHWPMMSEYTISESLGPAALAWGHLAGRPAGR